MSPSLRVLLATVIMLPFGAGCNSSTPLTVHGTTMGTTYQVKLRTGESSVDIAKLKTDIDALLERINDQMSTYRPESEVSRFNRAAAGEWFPVSAATAEVVAAALDVSGRTGGALDVTVGPLVRLWDFGAGAKTQASLLVPLQDGEGDEEAFKPPSRAELEAARRKVGYQRLTVRADPPALRKEVDTLEIDLSSVAKGYGVDQVAALLESRGVRDYMVEIGGEVRAGGLRADGLAWQIGIERPVEGRRQTQVVIPLADAALATSGDYRSFHELAGRRYSHIIDPASGRPVEHDLASVSVLADACLTADAWSTGLLVLGPERGYNSAEELGIAALLITRTGAGFDVRTTTAWQERIEMVSLASSMTITYVIATIVIAIAILGLAVGVILRNRQIRGSCGGLANLRDKDGNLMCDACDHPSLDCTGDRDVREDARENAGEPDQ